MPETLTPDITETEEQLVQRAQAAVSHCNWEVGLCAMNWTQKYARGRTDADFAAMVGLSADQVYQRRRVAEGFSDLQETFSSLKWSHYYSAVNWDDARECLQWADENQATVAEMKAWRRAIRGEDLTAEPAPDEFGGDPAIMHLSGSPAEVREVGELEPAGKTDTANGNEGDRAATVAAAARGTDGEDYAPFRSGAASPAPGEQPAAGPGLAVAEGPSALRVVKRATTTLQRINEALSPEVLQDVKTLPQKVRDQFTAAVAELSSKTAGLL